MASMQRKMSLMVHDAEAKSGYQQSCWSFPIKNVAKLYTSQSSEHFDKSERSIVCWDGH